MQKGQWFFGAVVETKTTRVVIKDIMGPTGATAQLSDRICGLSFEDLDQATISIVKRLIADGIAVAIAGSKEVPPTIIANYVREVGCKTQSSVWGFGFKTSPAYAAYANAVSMHVLDFEPMSNPPTHALSPTAPGVFALAESLPASGKDIVVACAKGIEIQSRVLAATSIEKEALPFHTPGVVGVLGAAVSASHLLRLDSVQLAHAIGMATSRCGGISANIGSMVKSTHCGNAAAAGVESALLARRGFSAHPNILEAEEGYVDTFFEGRFDYDVLLAYGHPHRCVDPGFAIKFYPSKYPTHFGIAAALDLREVVREPSGIKQIRILAPAIDDTDRPQPRSGLEAKYSFQYTVAAALLDGHVSIDTFTDERRFRPDLVALLQKISVVRNPVLSRDARKLRVEVEVTLKDGTTHRQVCTKPPGFWGEPVNAELHEGKLRDCLGVRLQNDQLTHTLDLLDNLERLSAVEVGQLLSLLA